MTTTLFDYLQYNNSSYNDLNISKEDKEIIERFAEKLKEAGLEETITSFSPAYKFNPRNFEHNGKDFISGFPQDLTNKMIVIWLHLTESEYQKPE